MAAFGQQEEHHDVSRHHLDLTPVEETLRSLLLDVAKYIDNGALPLDESSQVTLPDELASQKVVLRFTGGWVRDKLLDVDSHDIDVAINKMTGLQFGLMLKQYLEVPGNPERYGLEGLAKNESQSNKAGADGKSKIVGGLHKIEANPEKSKHLETVTTRILGLDIDLVNLRKETYTEESRNPQMEFGTPEEDALRRDATVNAMFYNLNTSEIEDFTGKGHDDMRAKIIRTPLEPYQTFKDDPLRVLRLIRFASRLGYIIDPPAERSMKDAEIKDALQAKISRERVGVELEKMLRGPDPYRAVTLIDDLALYPTIFSDPTQEPDSVFAPDLQHWRDVVDAVKSVVDDDGTFKEILIRDAEERYAAWILATMVPYRDAPQPQPSAPGRKMPPPVATAIAREGIKATNKVCEIITASIRNASEIASLVRKQSDQKRRPHRVPEGENALARDVLGMAVRRWGQSWRSQVVFAFLTDVADEPQTKDTLLREYSSFVAHLRELDLLDVTSLKPLLDGKALAKALSTSPGPWMKEALDVVMAWQLRNPKQADKEGALEEVKSTRLHGELTADLVSHFLRLTIRPLFAQSQHPAVTAQGRKVTTTVLPRKLYDEEPDEIAKPWKSHDSPALDLLGWVVRNLDQRLTEKNWPMVIPALLSVTDDVDVAYKAKGCELLTHFLNIAPPSLLPRTGLGEVFEEALMPCLGYLPTLTPEHQSVKLLSAAYPALIALSKAAYSKHAIAGIRTTSEEFQVQRTKFLDRVVRKGIFFAYAHSSENVKITKVLLDSLGTLNEALGIESVKHLKYSLPILTEVLRQPFGATYPPTLLAAVKALQNVILNGWPRMGTNRGEVLKGLTLCWLQIHGEQGEGLDEVRDEAKAAVQMLKAAVGDECDLERELTALIEADARLDGLLR